jgi:hypothetical protein
MSGVCSTYGVEERCIHDFEGKPGGKRPLGRPWPTWILMDIQEVGLGGTD